MGVPLAGVTGSIGVTLNNNSVTDGFYGYMVYGNATLAPGNFKWNHIRCVTRYSCRKYTGGPLAPSNLNITGMHMSGFTGNYPALPAYNFHAGVYTFTAGSTIPSTGLLISVSNDTIIGTGSISASGAAVYLGDFSTGGISVQTVNITQCVFLTTITEVLIQGVMSQQILMPVLLPIMEMRLGVLEAMKALPFSPSGVQLSMPIIILLHTRQVAHNVYAFITGNISGSKYN